MTKKPPQEDASCTLRLSQHQREHLQVALLAVALGAGDFSFANDGTWVVDVLETLGHDRPRPAIPCFMDLQRRIAYRRFMEKLAIIEQCIDALAQAGKTECTDILRRLIGRWRP